MKGTDINPSRLEPALAYRRGWGNVLKFWKDRNMGHLDIYLPRNNQIKQYFTAILRLNILCLQHSSVCDDQEFLRQWLERETIFIIDYCASNPWRELMLLAVPDTERSALLFSSIFRIPCRGLSLVGGLACLNRSTCWVW